MFCPVHRNFKCIMVMDKADILNKSVPVPLLSRAEKQEVARKALLSVGQRLLLEVIQNRCMEFADGAPLAAVFPGFDRQQDETLSSLVLLAAEECKDFDAPEGRERALAWMIDRLLWSATPESVLRSLHKRHENFGQSTYFTTQQHGSLSLFLQFAIRARWGDKHGMLGVVLTHASIGVLDLDSKVGTEGKGEEKSEEKSDDVVLSASVIENEAVESEHDWPPLIRNFVTGPKNVLVVRCNAAYSQRSERHLMHLRNILQYQRALAVQQLGDRAEAKEKHIVMLVHVRRSSGAASTAGTWPLVFDRQWRHAFIDAPAPPRILAVAGGQKLFAMKPSDVLRSDDSLFVRLHKLYRRCLTRLHFHRFDASSLLGVVEQLLTSARFDSFRKVLSDRLGGMLAGGSDKTVGELLLDRLAQQDMAGGLQRSPLEGGSFLDACWSFLEKTLEASFSVVLGAITRNFNLALLMNAEPGRQREEDPGTDALWLVLFGDPLIFPLRLPETPHERIAVDLTIECRYPFSCFVMETMNSLRSAAVEIAKREQADYDDETPRAAFTTNLALEKVVLQSTFQFDFKANLDRLVDYVRDVTQLHEYVVTRVSKEGKRSPEGAWVRASNGIVACVVSAVCALSEVEGKAASEFRLWTVHAAMWELNSVLNRIANIHLALPDMPLANPDPHSVSSGAETYLLGFLTNIMDTLLEQKLERRYEEFAATIGRVRSDVNDVMQSAHLRMINDEQRRALGTQRARWTKLMFAMAFANEVLVPLRCDEVSIARHCTTLFESEHEFATWDAFDLLLRTMLDLLPAGEAPNPEQIARCAEFLQTFLVEYCFSYAAHPRERDYVSFLVSLLAAPERKVAFPAVVEARAEMLVSNLPNGFKLRLFGLLLALPDPAVTAEIAATLAATQHNRYDDSAMAAMIVTHYHWRETGASKKNWVGGYGAAGGGGAGEARGRHTNRSVTRHSHFAGCNNSAQKQKQQPNLLLRPRPLHPPRRPLHLGELTPMQSSHLCQPRLMQSKKVRRRKKLAKQKQFQGLLMMPHCVSC